jgi:hypothetical protein
MMAWSPTEQRNGVSAAIRLLSRPEWRESSYKADLLHVLRDALEHDDRVLRYHAARAVRLLEPEPGHALALLRRRLLVEPEPEIAAELVARLAEVEPLLPDDVAALVPELVVHRLWVVRLASADSDTVEALVPLVGLVVRLAVARDDRSAARIALDLLSNPIERPIARRGVFLFRDWLALAPERGAERSRAFAIVLTMTETLTSLLGTTLADDSVDLYHAASSIASQLYFASGAFGPGERSPTPPHDGFAHEAFPVLEALTAFMSRRSSTSWCKRSPTWLRLHCIPARREGRRCGRPLHPRRSCGRCHHLPHRAVPGGVPRRCGV